MSPATARSPRSRILVRAFATAGLLLAAVASPTPATAQQGSQIINSARLYEGTTQVAQDSVTVSLTQRTPAALTFYVYRPNSPLAQEILVQPTDYYADAIPPGGLPPADAANGDFAAVPPLQIGGSTIPVGFPLPLVTTTDLLLHGGEPLFLTLADGDQNIDPLVNDSVLVNITSSTGDIEILRLVETGPNTGVFSGCIMTVNAPSPSGDGTLHVTTNGHIDGIYTDIADGTDTSTDAALIDPLGIVFDSSNGNPVSGATVNLYRLAGADDPVGSLANGYIFADDGVSPFPPSVTSGDTAYGFAAGGFRFPLIAPGFYRIEIIPPEGYLFPSTAALLDDFGYTIVVGSRGEPFEVVPGPAMHIDIPVDPLGTETWLQKQVNRDQAQIGDFLQYRLMLNNANSLAAMPGVVISDRLPAGFRYQSGSTRIDGGTNHEPAISADGRELTFTLGDIPPATQVEVSYVVEVAAGTRSGQAVNQAQAVDAGGNRSNLASAAVEVHEVFFRDAVFLAGRVLVGGCETPDTAKTGLTGIRIYLEDGTYVVTDPNGSYHFEGIAPGTHVVQLDTLSLPQGYQLLACEASSQTGHRDFSQFVDLQGGTLWRVNFHVAPPVGSVPAESEESATIDQTQARQEAKVADDAVKGLLFPVDGRAVNRIEAIRLRLDSKLTPRLTLDGQAIDADRIGFRMSDPESKTTLYTYVGIDFGPPGTRKLLVEGLDPFGNIRFTQTATLIRTGEIASIRLVEAAENRADGRTPIRIRVEMIDVLGAQVQAGTSLNLENSELLPLGATPLAKNANTGTVDRGKQVDVDPQGWITFNPVDRSGRYPLRLTANGAALDINIFIKPQMRDWILVGFAQGTAGYNTLHDNQVTAAAAGIDEHGYTDGQVKFFAKGAIKGEWLLTLAYDSDKPELDGDSLQQIIDPDTYYPLYGDETRQDYEAASASDIYVKLERDQFYAMFGDMETGLTQTVLSQYSRSMNGFKAETQDERFAFTVFAADTRQAFVKDELRGDGTSGRYALSQQKLVINSETVTIETRDRFHNEVVLKEVTLARHIDYDIDYSDGTLYFKRPVPSKDENFNPVFIVVRYETLASEKSNLNYGGRVAVRAFDQRVEAGASVIHEESGAAEGDLYGADLTVRLTPRTTLRAEVATSEVEEIDDSRQGDAYLAEVEHHDEKLEGRAWFRQQDADFGLGQQSGGTEGMRTFGLAGSYRFNPRWSLAAEAWHEDNLDSDAKRDVATLEGQYRAERFGLLAGIREARDQFDDGDSQRSRQLLLGGDWSTFDRKLTVRATHEQSLGSSDANADFPTRTMIGADYQLTRNVSLFAEQEFTWGDREDTEGTRIGVKAVPWQGGEVRTAVERQAIENGERIFALFGLGQSWQLSKQWSVDLSIDRSYTIKHQEPGERVNANVPSASGGDDDFTAVSVGAAYQAAKWSWWNRLETRQGDSEDKVGISTGLVGELQEGLAVSAQLMAFLTDSADGMQRDEEEMTLGLAYRPDHSRWIILERVDLALYNEDGNGSSEDGMRIVNHLHANCRSADRKWQTSYYYGLKYVRDNFDSDSYDGYTDMLAIETRYNIDSKWDIGVHGAALHSWNGDQFEYSAGADVGYLLMTNTWLSIGYNLAGFEDEDFSAANYTAEGPYVRFRMKFDQQSVKEAVAWFSK